MAPGTEGRPYEGLPYIEPSHAGSRQRPGLNHHTLELYENIWLGIAGLMAVFLFVAVLASLFSGTFPTIRDTGGHNMGAIQNGRVDPARLNETPFAKPGVYENPDGTVEAWVVARAFNFTPTRLEVPAGRPITMHVTSADVLHGFHVEGTNINTEVLPGHVATYTVTFRHPGETKTICNEYCGAGHHSMINKVVVLPEGTPVAPVVPATTTTTTTTEVTP
ncbi:cytochrome c oxidase subunit II [Deinococcus lacus]|uniref:Cytochrome c oxidase subunit II n=1 Tax=Deinococcus lacus TaxID=392561 RepID=A0ABW1YG88_9DEIO